MTLDEKDIPIDIHLNKLLDWLISRRHCARDWQKEALIVRQKINNAIQDMPAVPEITELLNGSYINYFHCCNIVEILKETEASSKNIFGHYSSQRMKDWLEVIKLYEKDNMYLAEVAQMLVRNVNFEIPSMKKQINKQSNVYEECLKKEVEYRKRGIEFREKYFAACKQIGIEGKFIKKELLSLLDDLPDALSEVTESIKTVEPAAKYYLDFINYTLQKDCSDICLPLTMYLMRKGNVTTYEWKKGEQPDIIEVIQPDLPLDVDNGSTVDDQIDFGDFGITCESGGGDDRSSSSPNGEFVHIEKEDCKVDSCDQIDFGTSEINWDITVEAPSSVTAESSLNNEGGKVARGEDALSILENPETRCTFFNELLELQGFLKHRLFEARVEGDVLSSAMLQSAPPAVQMQSDKSIAQMVEVVNNVCLHIMSTKMKHLYLIKESSKYVDRLAESLRSKLDTSEKMFLLEKTMQEKAQTTLSEQKLLNPKLNLIVSRSKELQSQIEADISKRYKSRPVNVMGIINQI